MLERQGAGPGLLSDAAGKGQDSSPILMNLELALLHVTGGEGVGPGAISPLPMPPYDRRGHTPTGSGLRHWVLLKHI